MRKFKTTDSLGNTNTIFVRPSEKNPKVMNVTMCNQHGYPCCLSNVVYAVAGYQAARTMLVEAVTVAYNAGNDITDVLYEITKQKWNEI